MELFFVLMGAWFMVAVALGIRRSRPDVSAARDVRARIDAVYSQPHEFRPVDAKQFPAADHRFYERAKMELDRLGYRYLADVEDVTITEAYPASRTFMRWMVDGGGLVRASIYHVHPRGIVVSVLQLVSVVPRHLRVVELVTEVDGKFLVTSNTHGSERLESPPEILIERVGSQLGIAKVVEHHQQRLQEWARRNPDRVPIAATTFDEYVASVARSHVVLSRFRQSVGGLSREELERLKGRPLTEYELAFLEQVQGSQSEAGKSVSDEAKAKQDAIASLNKRAKPPVEGD